MDRWRAWLLVVLYGCSVLLPIAWTFPAGAEPECVTAQGLPGVLVPAERCETFRKETENAVVPLATGSSESAPVCCPVFRNEPSCGRVSEYDGTFNHDSRETELDQFPWAVVISKGYRNVCSGTLITHEFVLSAAHCYTAPKSLVDPRYRVRLGDWELTTDLDCRYVRGREICNEQRPVVIPVRSIVNHRLYDPKQNDFLHDIALLRLERPVDYGALIGPACLPETWSTEPRQIVDRSFTATGWGKSRSFWSLKRKLKIVMVGRNMSVCRRVYTLDPDPVVDQVQLCVGGDRRRDVCFGDSGGALMHRDGDHWTQEGIISFGVDKCFKGAPGVYTNVAYYLDWIQRVIQDTTG